jgi:transposase
MSVADHLILWLLQGRSRAWETSNAAVSACSAVAHRCSRRCWPPFACRGSGRFGPASGRRRRWPQGLAARAHRAALPEPGITAVIPEPADQAAQRRRRGPWDSRPVGYDRIAYRGRNVAERTFNQLKAWREIATRYEKYATAFRGAVVVAAITLWLRH